jgi:hypothetical protein
MKKLALTLVLLATSAAPGFAQQGTVPQGIPHLDHVFLIMMENHGYTEIIGNPNAKFINQYAKDANLATTYFAVAHPSLTNYLEVAGGSNFGVLSDQHGRGNSTAFCNYDPVDNGKKAGLNPALIILGDQEIQRLVTAIHSSSVWNKGHNAIVVVWDENDYAVQPIVNRVVMIVDTNYGVHGQQSSQFYTHFSLLRSIEGGLGLPCLNHACDASTNTMSDLFGQP